MKNSKRIMTISGMTCGHCEQRIEHALLKQKGMLSAKASFPKKQAVVSFDLDLISEKDLKRAVQEEGYRVKSIQADESRHPIGKVVPIFLLVIAAYVLAKYTIGFDFFMLIPQIDQSISLMALFVTGLLTSVHCIAMCGGINLSQSVGVSDDAESKFKKPLLYNLGRVISYTVIGGIVGGIGSVLFISVTVKGVIMLIAAAFMILMSLSMLGWIPHWLVPRLPRIITGTNHGSTAKNRPFVVGLLNGLMPCGPLQAMQIYALSTGSVLMGAFSMMLFALGTVPLMLGAGMIFSVLKGKFSRGITRVSAVLVLLIALVMVSNGGGLLGWNVSAFSGSERSTDVKPANSSQAVSTKGYAVAQIKDGIQYVEADLQRSNYPSILVQKGVPVRFTIKAKDSSINGCNNTVVFPSFNLEKELVPGDNVFEFTPQGEGTIAYTCWMGMISGKIKVVGSLENVAAQ